jgi:glutaredoxin
MNLKEEKGQSNETVVWSKDNCHYCKKAKSLLDGKGIRYEERNISKGEWGREQLLETLAVVAPNASTMPQIWLHGKYIGGCDALEKYFEEHDMWRND